MLLRVLRSGLLFRRDWINRETAAAARCLLTTAAVLVTSGGSLLCLGLQNVA
jgi:hypothetical protein